MENKICDSCGEIIPQHEYTNKHLDQDDDLECMSCEIKWMDSFDIDNF